MSTAYDERGRVDQKRRTRQALVEAARALIADGAAPTIEDAAAHARVSRATAYRYFPTRRDLLVAAHPEIDKPSLLSPGASEDPAARLDEVVRAVTETVAGSEAQQRTMLRLSLEATAAERASLVLRQGRAIGWIEEALEPLRPQLGAAAVRRLACAIRATVGIESYVWLVDVAGMSREESVATMRWSASALLRAAVADGPPPTARRRGPGDGTDTGA